MMPTSLRSILRRVRDFKDRALHPLRRRAALYRLRRRRIHRVLFVCHGNINRSVYAAARFGALVRDGLVIESAGFIGPGRRASPTTQLLASKRGLDVSDHRSRLIGDLDVREMDLIVVMDSRQRRAVSRKLHDRSAVLVLGDLDPVRGEPRAVLDPYGHPVEVFERVYDRLDRCVEVLAGVVQIG